MSGQKWILENSSKSPANDKGTSILSEFITILQCNIGGAPESRLAEGSTLRNYINLHKPTFIGLTETKKQRKHIPELPEYKYFTLDPLPGSSGGIAFYYKNKVSFRISKALSSLNNSILWIYLQHHAGRERTFIFAWPTLSILMALLLKNPHSGRS